MPGLSIRALWSQHRLEVSWGILVAIAALSVRILLAAGLYLNPDEAMHLSAACAKAWNIDHHPPLLLWWVWLASYVS
jgi:hypothetical protein